MEEGTNWKEEMLRIMFEYQTRQFDQEIESLAGRGESLQWIQDVLETSFERGIEGS